MGTNLLCKHEEESPKPEIRLQNACFILGKLKALDYLKTVSPHYHESKHLPLSGARRAGSIALGVSHRAYLLLSGTGTRNTNTALNIGHAMQEHESTAIDTHYSARHCMQHTFLQTTRCRIAVVETHNDVWGLQEPGKFGISLMQATVPGAWGSRFRNWDCKVENAVLQDTFRKA
jgi:hypothetical protein